jgi:hypothetical protein
MAMFVAVALVEDYGGRFVRYIGELFVAAVTGSSRMGC